MNTKGNGKKTQADRILAYLKTHESITGLEALNLFGCMRLPARIADLRRRDEIGKEGIVSVKVRTPSKKYVASYSLKPELKEANI